MKISVSRFYKPIFRYGIALYCFAPSPGVGSLEGISRRTLTIGALLLCTEAVKHTVDYRHRLGVTLP